ncbi:hypothetical protein FA15DRAFT_60886 [Coprinopsis marcescibilis]|uniref:Non-specific serine/threonine protein kinase n=1 Tax=Coprinopsis marcescibilis TaxID=230819 RepID=A0A5C3L6X3_COPMA|nr:hypothetical protein FA15DRAFT_60886 [Coprinopsis marcescibilis]
MSTAAKAAAVQGVKNAASNATNPSTSTSPIVIRTGTLYYRERSAFGGRAWKSKGVTLDESGLTIHQPASSRHLRIPLLSVVELERTDLMPHSLSIRCASGKTHHIAFDSDSDLYDWRDDMYSRCPLGMAATNPFNFQHTGHIGASGATGTFAEATTLSSYEEMMGRSTPATTPPAPAAISSRSRSAQTAAARRRSNPLKGTHVILNNNNNLNAEGVYFIKQTGMFAGWYWKERWLSLKGELLTVHTRKTKASPPAKEIPLSTITSVEPDPKRSNCLIVSTTRRETCINILFPTDRELYAWREAIYLRSGLSAVISTPTNFVHAMHVTYDEATGELKGLPDQWKTALYPSHSAHIVKLPIQPTNGSNGANNSNRSARRRSHPSSRSPDADAASSPPLFSNLTRVPPPSTSADTDDGASPLRDAAIRPPPSSAVKRSGSVGPIPGTRTQAAPRVAQSLSSDSQLMAGTSVGSDGTLVSVSPHVLTGKSVLKVDELGPVQE